MFLSFVWGSVGAPCLRGLCPRKSLRLRRRARTCAKRKFARRAAFGIGRNCAGLSFYRVGIVRRYEQRGDMSAGRKCVIWGKTSPAPLAASPKRLGRALGFAGAPCLRGLCPRKSLRRSRRARTCALRKFARRAACPANNAEARKPRRRLSSYTRRCILAASQRKRLQSPEIWKCARCRCFSPLPQW